MAKTLTEKQKEINVTVSRYLKAHGITHQQVAERLGYSSKQVVDNQLSCGHFGKVVARRWSAEFGFSEKYLTEGKGQLIERPGGYRKIVDENEQLKAIVRIQRQVIDGLRG